MSEGRAWVENYQSPRRWLSRQHKRVRRILLRADERKALLGRLDQLRCIPNSRSKEELQSLTEEEQNHLAHETATLVHDLLRWYTVDELAEKFGTHTEFVVLSDILYHGPMERAQ